MKYSHADFERYTRALLLRNIDMIDARIVDEFVTSEMFSRAIAACDDNLLYRFKSFATERGIVANGVPPSEPTAVARKHEVSTYKFPELSASTKPGVPTQTRPHPFTPQHSAAADMRAAREELVPATSLAHIAVTTAVPSASPGEVAVPLAPNGHAGLVDPLAHFAPPVPADARTIAQANATAAAPHALTPPQKIMRSSPSILLPNGREGEVYEHAFIVRPAIIDELSLLEVIFPVNLDLSANLSNGLISGTPALAGEFSIDLIYCFKAEGAERKRKATIPFLVNADPKSLWKDLPSNRSDVFWKESATCDAISGPEFRIVAASKRGRSHAHVGSFRDDDYFIHHLADTGWYTAIVADGAGSAKYSRQGAKLVCDAAGAYLVDALNGPIGTAVADATSAYYEARLTAGGGSGAVDSAWQTLRKALYTAVGHAAFHGVKAITDTVANCPELQAAYKDFSTTALISVTRRFPFGTLCAAYWVGDGAVGIYSKTDGVKLLGDVDSGEFSGQTRFLDSSEVTAQALLRRTRFELVDELTALVLMTDGVSDPKFETEANLGRAKLWDDLWQDLSASTGLEMCEPGVEQRLLSWLDFWSQGNHDDRTIAIVY